MIISFEWVIKIYVGFFWSKIVKHMKKDTVTFAVDVIKDAELDEEG